VRRAFDHAAASYDAHAVLQREVCDRLLERLDYMTLQPGRVLDVGTGTGYGLAHLRARYAEAELCALDIAPAMLSGGACAPAAADLGAARPATPHASTPLPLTHLVCADMERLPLAANSLNLVWSSLWRCSGRAIWTPRSRLSIGCWRRAGC
jgi:malonyl-CoA O-methyltransferase